MPDPTPTTSSALDKLFGGASASKPEASDREKYIKGLTPNQIQIQVEAGVLTAEEVTAAIGAGPAAAALNGSITAADQAAIEKMRTNPPTNIPAAPVAPPSTAGDLNLPAGTPTTIQDRMKQALVTGKAPLVPEGTAPTAQSSASSTGPSAASSRASGGNGGSGGSANGGGNTSATPNSSTPATPPPPAPNSPADFANRGALAVGNTIILNGQQYRDPNKVMQADDGLWYVVGANGQPVSTGFKTQTAAKAASPYESAGPAVASRNQASPLYRASQRGGYVGQVESPLFKTYGLDESIAAGATKGIQNGEVLTTIQRKGYQPLDVTAGGIEAGGGLTPVSNAQGGIESFTGQLPGNVSIGMSSITGNGQGAYWLQQQGIPMSVAQKLSPQQQLALQATIDNERAKGTMPDLAALASKWEPSLSGQNISGNSTGTPYDTELARLMDLASTPDLTYLPDPAQGDDPDGDGYDIYGMPITYAHGGQFMTDGPMGMVDLDTGKMMGIAGEAGYNEKVTIDPMGQDVTLGRERKKMRGGLVPFAAGGTIYAGPKKGFVSQYDDEDPELGYKPKDFQTWPGSGGTSVYNAATGSSTAIATPIDSTSGQPVQARFANMSPQEKAKYTEVQAGQIGATPTGQQAGPNGVLPIYDQPITNDWIQRNLGTDAVREKLVPVNVGGVPALMRTYEAAFGPNLSMAERQARSKDLAVYKYKQGMISLDDLFRINPTAALDEANGGGRGGRGGGWMGGYHRDQQIEDEARRRRQYDIDSYNWQRAGLPPPTILGLDTMSDTGGTGTGEGGGGGGDRQGTQYYPYSRKVQNGYALPFDYEAHDPWANRDGLDGYGRGMYGNYMPQWTRGGWRPGFGRGSRYDNDRSRGGRGRPRFRPQGAPLGMGLVA